MDKSPEAMWKKFVEHLQVKQPLGKLDKVTGELPKHVNLLGSVSSYRKIFLEANKT